MDPFGSNRRITSSNTISSPERTSNRIKQLERELGNYRQTISSKEQEIHYLNDRNRALLEAARSKNPSDKLF